MDRLQSAILSYRAILNFLFTPVWQCEGGGLAPEAARGSDEVGGGAAERVILPLEHGGQVDHGGGMASLGNTKRH